MMKLLLGTINENTLPYLIIISKPTPTEPPKNTGFQLSYLLNILHPYLTLNCYMIQIQTDKKFLDAIVH